MNLNNTTSINGSGPDSFITTIEGIICVIVSITGIVGNILVLIVFLSKWASLKTYEIFIVSLAVADLIGTLTYPSMELHRLTGGNFKMLGTNGCKIIFFFPSLSFFVSSLTLTMVSIDRYIAVKWPFKQRHYLCREKVIVTWLVGTVCAFINIMKVKEDDKDQLCTQELSSNGKFHMALFVLAIQNAIPVITMAISYTLIVYELHKNSARTLRCVSQDEIIRRRRHIKSTSSLLLVIVIVYLVCVTPHNIFYILYTLGSTSLEDKAVHDVYGILSMIMMTNSCVNPLIYGKLHQPYRKRIIRLFRSMLFISKMPRQISSWYRETFVTKNKTENEQCLHWSNENDNCSQNFIYEDADNRDKTEPNNENENENENEERSLTHNDTIESQLSRYISFENSFTSSNIEAKRKLVRQSAIYEECIQTVDIDGNEKLQSLDDDFYNLVDLETGIKSLDRETYL